MSIVLKNGSLRMLLVATRSRWSSLPIWLIAGIIALVALIPRSIGLADFYTIDESYHWVGRVGRFSSALANHNWLNTIQTGHPGVTTLWLGMIGHWLGQLFHIPNPGKMGGGAAYLAILRLPLAIVNSLAVAIGYLLLRKLLRPRVALLAALLWATDPFLIGYDRLLHVDGLLTSFLSLSLLLLLIALQTARLGRLAFIGSAICAGLALLTKSPTLILLPIAGLTMFAIDISKQARKSPPARWFQFTDWIVSLRRVIPPYLIWLAIMALVVVLVWPAMWSAPEQAIGRVVDEIVNNGGEPTDNGNYFNGAPVADPGLAFYPVAIVLRTRPLTLLGLFLFPIAIFLLQKAPIGTAQRREYRVLLALIGFIIGFTIVMSIEPKKFDRYILPIWPVLLVIAAVGLIWLYDTVRSLLRGNKGINIAYSLQPLISVIVLIGLGIPLIWYHPYEIAYYNPLLGGEPTAERMILVGWGEGMAQVGAWLSSRPDLKHGQVLSWTPPDLAPFLPSNAYLADLNPDTLKQPASYAVLYVRSVQRKESAEAEASVRQTVPLYTLQMFGITYATVHQLPRPFTIPFDTLFDQGLHLRGFSWKRNGDVLVITPSWDIQHSQPADVMVFLHLLNDQGQRVAQQDALLDSIFPAWQAGQQFDDSLQINIPTNLPAGHYRVLIGLYHLQNGTRLAVTHGPTLPKTVDGPNAMQLMAFDVP